MTPNQIDSLFASAQRDLAGLYSLERELGRGGMAIVYLAREVELDRLIALKVLPADRARDPDLRERFLREARMAASLSHPNIVPIHRVGEVGSTVFFAMTYIDGGTLGDRLRTRGPLSPTATARMLREVAQALAYAHRHGIIHRDVKPDNILIDSQSGRAMVTDFGIATLGSSTGEIAGTMHFMPPELLGGNLPDARGDIYSLGVVGYLSITGLLPSHHPADTTLSPRHKPLGAVAPNTPRTLAVAVESCLAIDPAQRFANAEALSDSLEKAVVAGRGLPAALRAWLSEKDPWRNVYFAWVVIVLFVLLIGDLFEISIGVFFEFGDAFDAIILASLPLVPAIIFQIRKTTRLLSAGYNLHDIRAALDQERVEIDEGSDSSTEKHKWFHAPARLFAWSLAIWLILSFTGIVPVPQLPSVLVSPLAGTSLLPFVQHFVPQAMSIFALPTLSAMGIPLLPGKRMKRRTLRSWFWNTLLGEYALRFLSSGQNLPVSPNTFRHTEVVLGSAISDLFRSLPTSYRHQLEELPDVIERLETHAAHARSVLVEAEKAGAQDEQLDDLIARAKKELAGAVGALETIRLDLLRMLGGDADLRASTTLLSAARRVSDELGRLRSAQSEVDVIVPPLGLDLRPNSPA